VVSEGSDKPWPYRSTLFSGAGRIFGNAASVRQNARQAALIAPALTRGAELVPIACRARFAGMASIDKSDAAPGAVPPHHVTARCRFEAIQRQINIGRKDVKRAVKGGSLIVDISHHADVNARNAVKVKHRGLVDFNAFQGSTLNHQNTSKKIRIKNFEAAIGVD
jgi:hypothetical protein